MLGYCTNVHAGADWAETRANLERFAVAVRQKFRPDGRMGVGLWLSAASARELLENDGVAEFAAWLDAAGLDPFTLNGFPYGDFHQKIVKHRVYSPTWMQPERLDYTLALVRILHQLLPAREEGSISTLPICWGTPAPGGAELDRAAANLRTAAEAMATLEKETGRLIHLCIEPEPGCAIERSEQVVNFFQNHLLPAGDEAAIRRHIRVCHDVCHASVMFEEQRDVLARYRAAGIAVGKVQVSAAVCAPFDRMPPGDRAAAATQLAGFNENRYLHQTVIRRAADRQPEFHEDLSLALKTPPEGEWRIHFHVPIYLERFGLLETTQPHIREALSLLAKDDQCRHYEVETYAWGVLPIDLRQSDLAEGIAAEMRWLEGLTTQSNPRR